MLSRCDNRTQIPRAFGRELERNPNRALDARFPAVSQGIVASQVQPRVADQETDGDVPVPENDEKDSERGGSGGDDGRSRVPGDCGG